jgi:hypothetical protein
MRYRAAEKLEINRKFLGFHACTPCGDLIKRRRRYSLSFRPDLGQRP